MKWPLQKTRWSLVTRTRYRSTVMVEPGTPGEWGIQGYATLPKGHEQARRHQVGRRAGVARVPFHPQPPVKVTQVRPGGIGFGPTGAEHLFRAATRLMRLRQPTLSGDQAVRVSGHQLQLAEDDRLLHRPRLPETFDQGRHSHIEHLEEAVGILAGDQVAFGCQGHRLP